MCPRLPLILLAIALSLAAAGSARAQSPTQAEKENKARIEWRAVEGARAYNVEVKELSDRSVYEGRATQAFVELSLPPGKYRMRVTVLNKFLKPASESPWFDIVVVKAIAPRPESPDPRSFPAGLPRAAVRVEGSGISEETSAKLVKGRTEIRGLAEKGTTPSGGMVFAFDLSSALPGDYDLAFENPGGLKADLRQAIKIEPPETWPTSKSPAIPATKSLTATALKEASLGPLSLDTPPPPEPIPTSNSRSTIVASATTSSVPAESSISASAPSPAEGSVALRSSPPRPLSERGFCLETAWSASGMIDRDFAERYSPSYGGGRLGFALPFGAMFRPRGAIDPGRETWNWAGIELALDASYFPASDQATGPTSFLAAQGGGGIFARSDFAFPINIVFRAGGGLAMTRIESSSALGASTRLSWDPSAYAGSGLRWSFGRCFLELEGRWNILFYSDAMLGTGSVSTVFGFNPF